MILFGKPGNFEQYMTDGFTKDRIDTYLDEVVKRGGIWLRTSAHAMEQTGVWVHVLDDYHNTIAVITGEEAFVISTMICFNSLYVLLGKESDDFITVKIGVFKECLHDSIKNEDKI